MLSRDVCSIFDPTTMNHKFTERETEVMESSTYNAFIKNCKDFILAFFYRNYSMVYTDYDLEKKMI